MNVEQSLGALTQLLQRLLTQEVSVSPLDFLAHLHALSLITFLPPFTSYAKRPHVKSALGSQDTARLLADLFNELQLPSGQTEINSQYRLLSNDNLLLNTKIVLHTLFLSGNWHLEKCREESNNECTGRSPQSGHFAVNQHIN